MAEARAEAFAREHAMTVLVAGILGLGMYLLVNALGSLFEANEDEENDENAGVSAAAAITGVVVKQAGRAALMSFLYLEVVDASMSFDGVIGDFAITADPILIALGLGVIGSAPVPDGVPRPQGHPEGARLSSSTAPTGPSARSP